MSRPTRRRRGGRTLLVVGLALTVLALVVVGLTGSTSSGGRLDPRSAGPQGTRALAALLRGEGVAVDRVQPEQVLARPGPGTTVVVPVAALLPADDVARLLGAGATVVLVDPTRAQAALVHQTPAGLVAPAVRAPRCTLSAALTAGQALTGGSSYLEDAVGHPAGCYEGTVVDVSSGAGRLVLLGQGDLLTNAGLATQGDAALALLLLGANDRVAWLPPRLPADAAGDRSSLTSLLPVGLRLAVVQLALAFVVLALWRGRRFGRVVSEPLPVIVRSAETVEGRARLYAAAGARTAAAETLRSAVRRRLTARLGLGRGATGGSRRGAEAVRGAEPALVDVVALRTGRPQQEVRLLLYATDPPEDLAEESLVRLVEDLDRLETQVVRP